MAEALVIVESPAKARTLNKFLGRKYRVESSMGHVRDLPKKELGVDVEDDFRPRYVVLETRQKVIDKLTKEAAKAQRILVATDPDREGEAIGWHLAEVLRDTDAEKPVLRIAFNEITKKAVLEALEHPTDIDTRRVDAQQARRILDRLMGYRLSPLLWDKVRRGLSAGRVQSVALRIVCEREKEIEAFEPREYWVVNAELSGSSPPAFRARLRRRDDESWEPGSEEEWTAVRETVSDAAWTVAGVETKERKRNPAPPFITSKFQQEASRRLRMPVEKAMRVAQSLYEGKSIGDRGQIGLITYMRTDSTRVSDAAIEAVRAHVAESHGEEYLPSKPRFFRSRKGAQEAHEAIRPTSLDLPPEALATYLSRDELAIYTLIWQRFVASQMKPALLDETIVSVTAGRYGFEARGSVLKFPGFLKVYQESADEDASADAAEQEGQFPKLADGERLELLDLTGEQKFTQPPPRFTEATLVKELEENGIGRPSTYASILKTLRQREYCVVRENRFHPTELGKLVTELLVASFGDLLDVSYTARLEEDLDEIADGERDWIQALREFHGKFEVDLERAKAEMRNVKAEAIETDEECDKCGRKMLLRWGKFGRFLACSGYPECKNTKEQEDEDSPNFDEDCIYCGQKMAKRTGRFGAFLACPDYPECRGTARLKRQPDGTWKVLKDRKLDENCPECEHVLVEREGRFGKFVACSNYPACNYIKQEKVGVDCPREDCEGGELVVKRSRRSKAFYGCNRYPECDFVAWDRPIPEACPTCQAPFTLRRETKRHGTYRYCFRDECAFTDPPDKPKPKPRKRSDSAERAAAARKTAARKAAKKPRAAKKKTGKKKTTKKKASKKKTTRKKTAGSSSRSAETTAERSAGSK